jgi:hypothetical protein
MLPACGRVRKWFGTTIFRPYEALLMRPEKAFLATINHLSHPARRALGRAAHLREDGMPFQGAEDV